MKHPRAFAQDDFRFRADLEAETEKVLEARGTPRRAFDYTPKFRASQRYLIALRDYVVGGSLGDEPKPTPHGRKLLGEETARAMRAMFYQKLTEHSRLIEAQAKLYRQGLDALGEDRSTDDVVAALS